MLRRFKKRWHVRYKYNKKHLVMDLTIAGAVLFLVALNIFWLYGGFRYFSDKLDLQITAQNEIVSGQNVVFKVKYENNNKFEVEDVILSFRFPEYFELKEVSRQEYDYQNNTLKLNDLDPGAHGELTVEGRVIGEIGAEQYLAASLHYYKTNKKGERLWGQFQKTELSKYTFDQSLLRIEAELPANLVNNQVFDWPITIVNESADITYKTVILEPSVDDEFIDVAPGRYVIDNFQPGATAQFNLKIKVRTEKEQKKIQLNLVWTEDQFSLVQDRWIKEQNIFQPHFDVSLKAETDGAVTPGEWVDLTLSYHNAGEFSLENVQLVLDLKSAYWDINNVQTETGRQQNKAVVWSALEVPRFTLLQPGEQGELKLRVKTRSYVAGSSDLALQTAVQTLFDVEKQKVNLIASALKIKMNSNLSASAYPVYYTQGGDQLGRGPLPGRVGEETKYWVFVKMVNDINAVNNVVVSAELPFNVTWGDRTNVAVGDPIVYDPSSRRILWNISKVPVQASNIGFAFLVSIVPTAPQAGTYPVLLQNIKVTGTDAETDEYIVKELGVITAQLQNDPKGKLKDGVVIK